MMPDDQDSDGILYKFIQLREETKKISDIFLESNIKIKKSFMLLNGFRKCGGNPRLLNCRDEST